MSLWAAVPHYVSQPPNPKATLSLLNRLEDLISVRIPLGELTEDSRAWQLGVDQLAAEDSEVAEYVQSLEEARDTAELPEASGEAIAREFERYLRRRDGQPGPGSHATESGGLAEGGTGGPGAPYLRDPSTGHGRPRKPSPKDEVANDAEDTGGAEDDAKGPDDAQGAQGGEGQDASRRDEGGTDRGGDGDEGSGSGR